jgi:hypothetical protein
MQKSKQREQGEAGQKRPLSTRSPWFPLLVLFGLVWCSLVLFGPKNYFDGKAAYECS